MSHDPRFWEKDKGYDAEGYQRKEQCSAVGECPACGKEVDLTSETEAWTQGEDGRWNHSEYGPAMGTCCDKLIVDYWEGCFVFDLEGSK
jgi:hypothetical protein